VLGLRDLGAYGAVYRAERVGDEGAGYVALKLAMHPGDERFEREVALLSRIFHPNVPRLRDYGVWIHAGGVFPYLVMDWVEGVPLYEWARGRGLSSRQVLRTLAQVARALAATHAVGGVHRDVKGGNVLVRREDARALLIDFGACDFHGARTLTRELLPPCTPWYRSPESLRWQERHWNRRGAHYEPGPADDVYALGVTAYRFTTGTYPPPLEEVVQDEKGTHRSRPTPVPAEAVVDLCPELSAIIHRMLSEKPSARGSAEEVAEALEHAAETAGPEADRVITRRIAQAAVVRGIQPRSRRPVRVRRQRLVVALGIGGSLAFLGWWTVMRQPAEQPVRGVARQERGSGGEDAGSVGLAKDALAASTRANQPEPTGHGLGLEVPKNPLPGQARAPCKRREFVINQGCWGRPEDPTPPCRERTYEWQGLCYYPVLELPPPPTSEPP
jgi:hypothetical protein